MPSYWLSKNLTTQNWLADRADFIFQSMTAHLSDYWENSSAASTEQLQYGQILHAVAEELAQIEAYGNYVYDQSDMTLMDPIFANISFTKMFELSSNFPRPQWYDDYYRTFLQTLGRLYLEVSSASVIKKIFTAYFSLTSSDTPNVSVQELYKAHGPDTAYNIVDQNIVNIEVPLITSLSETALDIMDIFDTVRPAHVMVRFVADVIGESESIHTATTTEAFVFTMYIIEERPAVKLLKWSDVSDEAKNTSWYKLFPGKFSADSQVQSGVFSPGIHPMSRYGVSSYEMTDMSNGSTTILGGDYDF